MSTEIHLFAEKRVDESWQPVPEPREMRTARPGQLFPVQAIDIGQPYELFTLLCGEAIGGQARFADVPKLFGGRGFPLDMNPVYQEVLPGWCKQSGADTMESWLELKELVAIDWNQPVRRHCYVETIYSEYFHPEKAFPENLPKDCRLLNRRDWTKEETARVEWSQSLEEFVGCGDWFIDEISALAPGADTRIIYWF